MPVSGRWAILSTFVHITGRILLLSRLNQITLGRRKKALLIAINYDDAPEQDIDRLRFPQRDLRKMRKLLQDKFDFREEDIITLTDDKAEVEASSTSRMPTRNNITQAVSQFIWRGENNVDYVLFYSGHGGQHLSDDPDEEDGRKEYIMPLDTKKSSQREDLPGSVIYDTFLHDNIILPLNETKSCHLFAVIDSCHSATLLNLKHHRCNRVGTFVSSCRRAIRHFFLEDVVSPLRNIFSRKTTSEVEISTSTSKPSRWKCNGLCPRVPNHSRKSTVICMSACKDRELTVEHDRTDTLTTAIVDLLQAKPQASPKDLVYTARGVALKILQAAKETLKQEEHSGWWKHIPSRNLFALSTDTSPEIRPLAKWNPQLSSNFPLDTNIPSLYSEVIVQELDRHGRVKRPALEAFQSLVSRATGMPNHHFGP